MSRKRKVYSASFKAKVALEAIKERKTLQELAAEYGVSPQFVQKLKTKIKDSAVSVFEDKRQRSRKKQEIGTSELLEEIGMYDWDRGQVNVFFIFSGRR